VGDPRTRMAVLCVQTMRSAARVCLRMSTAVLEVLPSNSPRSIGKHPLTLFVQPAITLPPKYRGHWIIGLFLGPSHALQIGSEETFTCNQPRKYGTSWKRCLGCGAPDWVLICAAMLACMWQFQARRSLFPCNQVAGCTLHIAN
jgi:hypothetical protein